MKTPLERIRRGAAFLAVVLVAAVIGYRLLGKDYGWIDALWMVVITISSVGYGESSSQGPEVQLLTTAVIVLGMTAAGYTVGGFVQLMAEGEIERLLGRRRMSREIESLQNHVILCGFGRVGEVLAAGLRERKRPFVVVEQDPHTAEAARTRGYLCLDGDAAEEDTLLAARVQGAAALATTLPSDAANVFITLTARSLCPEILIIARAEHASSKKMLLQAGANKIVMPALTSAQQMVRMITRPSTADLMDLLHESNFLDMDLDEIVVPPGSKLMGVSVRQTEAHRRHRLLVVAVKQASGAMVFNPDADYRFACGDIVIIMGHTEDIQRFREEYEL